MNMINESDALAQARANVTPVSFSGIPTELHELRQWVLWQYCLSPRGTVTKVPFSARTNKRCDATNSTSWVYLEDVQKAYEHADWSGIGLSLVAGIVALDFDHVIENNTILMPYSGFLKKMNTYNEKSPSGSGVRAFLFGRLPGSRRRNPAHNLRIELYEDSRYVSVTGQPLSSTTAIRNNSEMLNSFYNFLFPAPPEPVKKEQRHFHRSEDINAIIERASKAKNGAKFNAFMRGDWQMAGNYPSHSEGTYGFLCILAYWTNGDALKMKQIFESSGMMSEKWNSARGGQTYGEQTIAKVLSRVRF